MDQPTKSRRERKQDRMRQQILQAAQDVVRLHGVEQLSLRLIAEQMDVTAATLYRYFESKEVLVSVLIAEAREQLRAIMAEQTPADLPPRDHLVALGLSYLQFARTYPALFQLAFLESPSERTSTDSPVSPMSPYRLLLDAVSRAAAAGVLRDEVRQTPESAAYSIWAMAHGMAVLEAGHLRYFPADFAAAHRLALQALVDGMTTRA